MVGGGTEEGGGTLREGAAQVEHLDDEEEVLLRGLAHEVMRMGRRRLVSYAGSVLDISAFRILWQLSEGGPRTLRELAEELSLEQSTVNRQVNAAIRRGLVERTVPPGGGAALVQPTVAGDRAYQQDRALRTRVFGAALGEVGRERAARLVADLQEFNDAIDRAHARP